MYTAAWHNKTALTTEELEMEILRDLQEWRTWHDRTAGLLWEGKTTLPVSFPCYAYKVPHACVYLYEATLTEMIFNLGKNDFRSR